MSMLVVQDVTNTSVAASSVNRIHKSQSSITPFKKVLKKEVEKKADALPEADKSSSASAVPDSSDGAVTGNRTLIQNVCRQQVQKALCRSCRMNVKNLV